MVCRSVSPSLGFVQQEKTCTYQSKKLLAESECEDEFGQPYELSKEEIIAVQELYSDAMDSEIEVFSVLELAQIVITSNLNRKRAFTKLKRLRKFEEENKMREFGVWESITHVLDVVKSQNLFGAPFLDDEGREVLPVDPSSVNFRKLSSFDDVYMCLHTFAAVGVNMTTDLRSARRGITIVSPCNDVRMSYLNVSLLRKQVVCGANVIPLKLKKVVCLNVSVATSAALKVVKGVISFFSPKLAKRLVNMSSNRVAVTYPKETLPKRYGGSQADFSFAEVLQSRFDLRMKAYEKVTCPNVHLPRRPAPYDGDWQLQTIRQN